MLNAMWFLTGLSGGAFLVVLLHEVRRRLHQRRGWRADMTAHTPGPWHHANGYIVNSDGEIRGYGWLRGEHNKVRAEGIMEANGNLLAAATELLEALELFAPFTAPSGVAICEEACRGRGLCRYCRGRAVLTKARGES